MRRGLWTIFALALANVAFAQAPAGPMDKAALEKKFETDMSGATLVGYFTVTGGEDKQLREERYTISKVSKISGDLWQFNARIQYGGKDKEVPLPLLVMWAGDTPVITVTDMPVPGFGTYTARVLIYRDEYAGTWSGKDHGGHLFGKITREPPAKE